MSKAVIPAVSRAVLDLICPPLCPSCDARVDEDGLCRDCLGKVVRPGGASCPRCGRERGHSSFCRGAHRSLSFTGRYTGVLRDFIHAYKFRGERALHGAAASMIVEGLSGEARAAEVVVPVPGSRRRGRKRGFDPVDLAARAAALELGLPFVRALVSVRETRPQYGLPRAKRAANVEGAYAADPKAGPRVEGRRVLLIDDVLTTGATAAVCTDALLSAGASEVHIAVIASGASPRARRRPDLTA